MNYWFWCIILPFLLGLLCAYLGYLYGREKGKEEVKIWKEKAASLETDLDACRKKRLALETDLNAQVDDLNTWKNKSTTLETSLTAANKSKEDAANSWRSKIAKLETDLTNCNKSKTEEATNLKNRIAKLEEELANANKSKISLEALNGDLGIWKNKAATLETNLSAANKSKEEEASNLNNRITKLEEELAGANRSKLNLEAQNKDLGIWKNKAATLETNLSAANKSKEDELSIWKNKTTTLETDLAACNKSRFGLQAELKAANEAPVNSFDADAAKAVFGKRIKQDDLKVVEGIGPKIEGLFNSFDIKTWKALSLASIEKCQEVLNSGGDRYKIHNPGTWPKQAELANEGKWAELLKWQDELDGGKA